MEQQSNVPKLRFPGFEGEWIEKSLGSVSDVSKLAGYEYTKHVIYSDHGNIIALRALNIKNNSLNLAEVKYIDGSDFSKLQRSKLYIGDLMFTYIGANIGDVALIDENDKYYLAPNVARIRSNAKFLDFRFIIQYFNIPSFLVGEISGYIASSSQPALSMESIRKFKVSLPPLSEQQKIASFLTVVDEKLQAFKKKKSLLEQYKKGVMQKIFSQELRFKGDDGEEFPDWEEKKIGQLLTIGSGRDYKHLGKGDVPVFGTGGYMTSVDSYLYEGETVCIGRKGTIDSPMYFSGKIWTVDTLFYTHKFIGSIPRFIFYVFQTINWKEHNEASGVPSLSKTTIEKIKVNVPSIPEQTKIANFLSAIDEKINLCGKEIEKTAEWKKGLLQGMFC
jgi:type I restriction enzyme S subunit